MIYSLYCLPDPQMEALQRVASCASPRLGCLDHIQIHGPYFFPPHSSLHRIASPTVKHGTLVFGIVSMELHITWPSPYLQMQCLASQHSHSFFAQSILLWSPVDNHTTYCRCYNYGSIRSLLCRYGFTVVCSPGSHPLRVQRRADLSSPHSYSH